MYLPHFLVLPNFTEQLGKSTPPDGAHFLYCLHSLLAFTTPGKMVQLHSSYLYVF